MIIEANPEATTQFQRVLDREAETRRTLGNELDAMRLQIYALKAENTQLREKRLKRAKTLVRSGDGT